MRKSALAVATTALALTAACTADTGSSTERPGPGPGATVEKAQDRVDRARDLLADIPKGPRSHLSWHRAAMVTLNGGERRVWLHADHPQRVARVAAYRGGYLVLVFDRWESGTGGAVFDAEGRRVRKLGGVCERSGERPRREQGRVGCVLLAGLDAERRAEP